MKKALILTIAYIFGLTSLSHAEDEKVVILKDNQLVELLKEPRQNENFHYAGTEDGFDFFVGEQWAMHSFPKAAKKTERFYKVKNSKLAPLEKFKATKNQKKWVLIQKAHIPKIKEEDLERLLEKAEK